MISARATWHNICSTVCSPTAPTSVTSSSCGRSIGKLADTILDALAEEFGGVPGMKWTEPQGGMYVWLTQALETGPESRFMKACLREGVLYVPGSFCYVNGDGPPPDNEARLCFGVASLDQLQEAVRRLGRAFAACGTTAAACR